MHKDIEIVKTFERYFESCKTIEHLEVVRKYLRNALRTLPFGSFAYVHLQNKYITLHNNIEEYYKFKREIDRNY